MGKKLNKYDQALVNRANLKGGFNFETGKNKVIEGRKKTIFDNASESDHQAAYFAVIYQNEPKPPVTARRSLDGKNTIVYEENFFDEKFLEHPLLCLRAFRHIGNGGHRDGAVAVQMKREGVRSGAFDISCDLSRRGFGGLRIEAKAGTGKLSNEQQFERYSLLENNFSVHVGWNYKELLDISLWYLGLTPKDIRAYPPASAIKPLKDGGHDERCGCQLKLADLW